MAEDSQLAQASQQLTFQDFLERMKDPAAADLVRYIKTFIKSVEDRPSNPEGDAQAFQDFMIRMEDVFERHPLWANTTADVKSQAVEALEKYVLTKLYSRTFAQSPLDRERDDLLTQRMAALSFIQPSHLDIPAAYCNESNWVLAQRELLRMDQYKAPRDKLVCILNCCRIINNLLQAGAAGADGVGADDFLPILIFVMVHANPPKLASNLEYIQRYRMQSRMMAEAAYFFTQMYSAASFVETINANSLTIDPDEFMARMLAAGLADTGMMAPVENPTSPRKPVAVPSRPAVHVAPAPPPAALEAAQPGTLSSAGEAAPTVALEAQYAALPSSAGGDPATTASAPARAAPFVFPSIVELEQEGVQQLLPLEAAGELRDKHRFLYATTADLTLGDIQTLLEQYKKLVLHYEALRSAVHARHVASKAVADAAAAQLQQMQEDAARAVAAALPALSAASHSEGTTSGLTRAPGASPARSQGTAVPTGPAADGTSGSMLKLLNPFTRVNPTRVFKGTLSLLDGPAALVSSAASTAATAWSATTATPATASAAAVVPGSAAQPQPATLALSPIPGHSQSRPGQLTNAIAGRPTGVVEATDGSIAALADSSVPPLPSALVDDAATTPVPDHSDAKQGAQEEPSHTALHGGQGAQGGDPAVAPAPSFAGADAAMAHSIPAAMSHQQLTDKDTVADLSESAQVYDGHAAALSSGAAAYLADADMGGCAGEHASLAALAQAPDTIASDAAEKVNRTSGGSLGGLQGGAVPVDSSAVQQQQEGDMVAPSAEAARNVDSSNLLS